MASIAVLILGIGCSYPPRYNIPLEDELWLAADEWIEIEPASPLPAPNDLNGVCFRIGAEWELDDSRPEWSFVSAGGDRAMLHASAVGPDGATTPLPSSVLYGTGLFCLEAKYDNQPPDPVHAVRLRSSVGIRIREVAWYSTYK